MSEPWHARSAAEAAAALGSDPRMGSAGSKRLAGLAAEGPNEIARGARISALAIFARQFRSAVVWLLLGAGSSLGFANTSTAARSSRSWR